MRFLNKLMDEHSTTLSGKLFQSVVDGSYHKELARHKIWGFGL